MSTSATAALATLAALAVTAATSAVAVGPAHAATAAFPDAAGDVRHGVDLRSVRVVNGEERVRVTSTHRDLVPHWSSGAGGRLLIDTDPSDPGPEYALVGGYFEGTDYVLLEVEGWNINKDGRVLRCPHTSRLDYDTDTVRSSFDRACFGDADVRVELRVTGRRPNGRTVVDWLGKPRTFSRSVPQG